MPVVFSRFNWTLLQYVEAYWVISEYIFEFVAKMFLVRALLKTPYNLKGWKIQQAKMVKSSFQGEENEKWVINLNHLFQAQLSPKSPTTTAQNWHSVLRNRFS